MAPALAVTLAGGSPRGPLVTAVTRTVEPFRAQLVRHRFLVTSAAAAVSGERCGARQLAPISDLRVLRARDPGLHDSRVVRLLDEAPAPDSRAPRPLRVRRLAGPAEAAAVHDQLLPDGDALHRLRHRDRVPVSARGRPAPAGLVRVFRAALLRPHPRRRLRLHLAQGSARVAVDGSKRLRDYGLKSERLLWPTKGPSVFERELSVEELEDRLMLTTMEKAVAWAQGNSLWPDTF